MKRVILIPMLFAVFSLFSQQPVQEPAFHAEPLSPEESQSLAHDFQLKKAQREKLTKAKTAGMVGQRMSHSDVAAMLFGNLLRAVYTPFAPDSNYIQVFRGAENINIHGFGQTFDPTSMGFDILGQPYFTNEDAYTIDTIYLGLRYRTADPTSGYTGDTLQVELFQGKKNNNSVWRVGIGYNANTWPNQPNRINVLPPRYTGNPAIGTPGAINAPNKIVIKYPLKDMDTTVNYIKIVPPSPIHISPGEKFGLFCSFIPGYTYIDTSQFYYVSGGKADVNNISWLYLTAQNSVDNTPYFLETLQLGVPTEGISSQLFSGTRYKSWAGSDAFRNEYVAPSTLTGNLVDFWVSGASSVGLNETSVSNGLNIYPNPGTGLVNIEVPESGHYTLSLADLTGKVVYFEELSLNAEREISRDFSKLNRGIYMVNLMGEEKSHISRLLLQ